MSMGLTTTTIIIIIVMSGKRMKRRGGEEDSLRAKVWTLIMNSWNQRLVLLHCRTILHLLPLAVVKSNNIDLLIPINNNNGGDHQYERGDSVLER
jgi:hypothetical protein